ncbi:MAG: hypothetical protein KAI29_08260 [Cyclobacteriaceae bacterium]|nr:hypothetical protein [Cyclobacteriaceae bacterium]
MISTLEFWQIISYFAEKADAELLHLLLAECMITVSTFSAEERRETI